MAESILKIHTQNGDVPVVYPGLADKPIPDKTLSEEGAFADSKAVGDKFKETKTETDSLKEDLSNKITKFYASNQGETHITDSDNGKIQDMIIYGKSSQDGTPTPENPVEIKSVVNPKVVVYGKNIAKKVAVFNESQQYTIPLYIVADLRPSTTYVLSFECASGYSGYVNEIIFEQIVFVGTGNRQSVVCKTKSVLQSSQLTAKGWIIVKNFTGNTIVPKFTNVMLERISASIAYEPYHEQTVTLPYALNAIPVSSGGNVTIDGQQYISDYVDVERGKLVRLNRFKKITSNDIASINDSKVLYAKTYDVWDSTNYVQRSLTAMSNISEAMLDTVNNSGWNGESRIRIKNVPFANIDEAKSYFGTNDVYCCYPLATSTETDLTTEEIQAFKALATYYPVTNISINSEQLDGYTVFNYPISMANGWNYVKKQLNDNRDYIYDMDLQSAEAYVNSEYAVALTELEV